MAENGNFQRDTGIMRRVIDALEDPRYDWRTVEGVAEQTGIAPIKVREILMGLEDEIVRSSIPDESGRTLYTTRKHYRDTQGLGTRLLSALAVKVA